MYKTTDKGLEGHMPNRPQNLSVLESKHESRGEGIRKELPSLTLNFNFFK